WDEGDATDLIPFIAIVKAAIAQRANAVMYTHRTSANDFADPFTHFRKILKLRYDRAQQRLPRLRLSRSRDGPSPPGRLGEPELQSRSNSSRSEGEPVAAKR